MGLLQTIFRWVIGAIVWLALIIGTLWTVGALWFDFPIAAVRHALAVSFGVGALALLVFVRPLSRTKIVVAVAIVLVAAWWFTLKPRQDRDWKPEVAVLGHATIEGERVTIHNVRNFDYRTETDFTPRYETRSYNLQNLRGIDLFVTYWGSPSIAHPILSFDFGEDGRVCFSIETRSQRGQSYSASAASIGNSSRSTSRPTNAMSFGCVLIFARARTCISIDSSPRRRSALRLSRIYPHLERATRAAALV